MKKYFSLVLAVLLVVTAIPCGGIVASAEEFMLGDGNGDNEITSLDARIALQVAAEKRTVDKQSYKALDVNEDNKVTSLDARMILKYIAFGSFDGSTPQEPSTPEDPSENPSDTLTPEELREILRRFGYEYDAEQDIYYTHLNPWQRFFGFADIYDDAAAYTFMYYMTLKIDFDYEDLHWRLQWWKGQYGVLEGAEIGVYTKKIGNEDMPFYKCADNDHLLKMYFEYYQTVNDYNDGNILFTREEQEHWWLTGFKFGIVNPERNVLKIVLYAQDEDMADGIESGLRNVTDKQGNWNGFVKYRGFLTQGYNYYIRQDSPEKNEYKFTVIWKDAGYLNYGNPENPEEAPDEPMDS